MFSLFNRNKTKPQMETEVQDLTEDQVTSLHGIAGGKDDYNSMMRWARTMKSTKYVQDFDALIKQADYDEISVAVTAIKKQFDTAMAADPEGTTEASRDDGYQPSEMEKKVWDMYFGENYMDNKLADLCAVGRMVLFMLEKEHMSTIDHIKAEGNDKPEVREAWELDLANIRSAMQSIDNI